MGGSSPLTTSGMDSIMKKANQKLWDFMTTRIAAQNDRNVKSLLRLGKLPLLINLERSPERQSARGATEGQAPFRLRLIALTGPKAFELGLKLWTLVV